MSFLKSKLFILALAAIAGVTVFSFVSREENRIEISPNKMMADVTAVKLPSDLTTAAPSAPTAVAPAKESNKPENPNLSTNPAKNLDNLTNRLESSLADEIFKQNINRVDTKKGFIIPKVSSFVADFIDNKITGSEKDFSADTDLKEIKSSRNNSKKAVREYLNSFKSIIDRYFSGNKNVIAIVKGAYQGGNFSEFDNLLLAYDGAIKDFYNLTAPSDWADLHREEIKVLISSKKVLEALRHQEEDPIKANLAMRGYYIAIIESFDLEKKINSKAATDKIWI